MIKSNLAHLGWIGPGAAMVFFSFAAIGVATRSEGRSVSQGRTDAVDDENDGSTQNTLYFAGWSFKLPPIDTATGDTSIACDTGIPHSTVPDPMFNSDPVVGDTTAITVGPYSSAVTSESAKVWARLDGAYPARVIWSRDPRISRDVRLSPHHTASLDDDYTLQWRLTGLIPNTTYYYQVLVDGAPLAPTGTRTFKTPPPESSWGRFRFVAIADARDTAAAPSLAYASREAPAFAIQLGDFDHDDPIDAGPDIENWRDLNRRVLREEALGEAIDTNILKHTPFYHTWDDHDYGGNDGDRFEFWKPEAIQSYFEYYPVPDDIPNPEEGIWYSFRWAQAEVFMLDDRTQRDRWLTCDTGDQSMLDGAELEENDQKTWLEEGLRDSTAVWKFIVSGSVWNPTSKNADSWRRFPTEQAELIDWIQDHGITGVIFITGDIHSGGAIDDGTYSTFPEISVPALNTRITGCTGGNCGDWAIGLDDPLVEGDNLTGYASIQISYTAESHVAVLRTMNNFGVPQIEYTLEQPIIR